MFPNALLGLADLTADIETFVRWVSKGPTEAERLDVSMNQGFIANALLGLADLISDIGSVIDWFVHLDDHIKSAGESFTRFLDGVENWAAEAGKAAANMVNAVADAIASLPSKMYEAGKNVWQGLVKGIQSGISNATGAAANLAKAVIDKFTTETDIHSPSKLFEQFGIYIDQGLANGITAAVPYVTTSMQGVVAAVQEKGNELINTGSTQATNYVAGFLNGLDTQWQQIDQSLQSDFFGSIGTLWDAISNGDLEKLGTWAASYFYHAMDDEQRKQIKSIADNSLQWLTQGLSSVWNNIAGMASSFISQFVPSAMAATSAQTSLNIAMDANPVMLVISLIGMLVGALVNFANKNKSIASFLSNLWYGIGDFFSIVFETILRVIGTAVQGFVDAINTLIWAWNQVPLHSKMDYVSNPMYDWADKVANERKESQRKRQEAANSSFDDSKDPTNYEQQYKELLEKYKNGSYPGTKEWDKNNGTSSGSYGGTTSVNVNINEEENLTMHFVDREAKYPNRWTMKKSDGTSEVITLVRNDEPIVEGTPMNAETLNTLSDVAGADIARIAAEKAELNAKLSEVNAKISAQESQKQAENSAESARLAEQSANKGGWMDFEQENGILYMIKSDSLTEINMQDNGSGILEVTFE